jgi:hypothetical protein
MGAKVPQADLKPGDVLLMQGTGIVSDLIRMFDQGNYSHAAVYDGANVVEMLSQGTTVNNIVGSSLPEARFVDVYRFISNDGKPLGIPGLGPEPVLGCIQYYVQNRQRYGYEQIVLLALLCATRTEAQKNLSPVLAMILRRFLDSAAEKIAGMIHAGKEPMICSELVYRCYTEAGPPYAIRVRGSDVPKLAAAPTPMVRAEALTPDEVDFKREAATFLLNYAVAKKRNLGTREFAFATTPGDIVAASAVADFVTPRDLETSPNLQMVGTLA